MTVTGEPGEYGKPSVWVAMCTFQEARFLEERLDRTLAQTVLPHEVVTTKTVISMAS